MVTSMFFPPVFVNSPIAQVNRPKILWRMVSGSSLLCSEVFVRVKLGLYVHGFKLVRVLGYCKVTNIRTVLNFVLSYF